MKAILAILFVSCAFAATRPKPSEFFESHSMVHIVDHNKHENEDGEAFWAAIQPKGLEVVIIKVKRNPENDSYSLGQRYEIIGNRNKECQKHPLSGKMPLIWGWLNNATYKGRHNRNGRPLDLWEATENKFVTSLGVSPQDPNTPVYHERTGPEYSKYLDISDSDFIVKPWRSSSTIGTLSLLTLLSSPFPTRATFLNPQKTQTAPIMATGSCVAGSTMISRAEAWVRDKVPYNQGATHDGYREDCSGYVSMAWGVSKPGYTTQTLPQISRPISKEELKPGDILLNRAEHVVIFGGWADSSRSQYVAYEETRPGLTRGIKLTHCVGEGTVRRVTPYPYWYSKSSFLPYRFNNIC